uniref:zinc ribbon domain-containing protein n=1 Tax=Acetatifactor sp. TaxID=1872090 RepID=UPI0040567B46
MKLLNIESAEMKQARQNLEESEGLLREKIFALGQQFYMNHKEDTESEYAEQIQLINRLEANRRSFFQKKLQLEGLMMCENCEAIIPYGSTFCNMCGKNASLKEESVQAEAVNIVKCRNCGAVLEKGAAFCHSCGCKVSE